MKIGTNILRMIIKQVRESITDLIPIRLITIDAVSDKVDWYTKEGFLKMEEALPGQKGYNEYMYIDCIKNKEKLLEYVEEYC